MHIGLAGTGRMGAALAARLIECGHQVTVWNRTPGKLAPLVAAGAKTAESPAALATAADVIITILTHAEAIDAVYRGLGGLLSGKVAGKLFIDMSTVQPKTEIALSKDVRFKGAALVECPVGGSTGPARQGRLLGFAGGEPADFARAEPILQQLCRRVELLGPAGAGASMKLAINLPLGIYWQALGEAYALCRHLGVDTAKLVELFAESSGGPNVLKLRGEVVAKALAGGAPGTPMFDVDTLRKDFRTMVAEARECGFRLPLTEQTLAVYDEASRDGWGGRDGTELPAYWSSKKRS